jgi:muramidase (phage lysozyme)
MLVKPAMAETPTEIELIEVTWQMEFEKLPEELKQIAKCESGLNPNAKNSNSTASGLFQFLDGTAKWVYKEVYNAPLQNKNSPFVQIEMAKWLYENYGTTHWQYPCGSLI